MKMKVIALMAALAASSPVSAQQPAGKETNVMNSPPADSVTVTEFYKQNVYDQSNNKIGKIEDVLVSKDGKIDAFVVGAGGFLGMGRHDVLVPFGAVKATKKNSKDYLVMNATKDELKNAPGFRYDRTVMTWTPDTASQTTGNAPPKNRKRSPQ
jgi:sporulation protein YlmC with PRC-barrel domain